MSKYFVFVLIALSLLMVGISGTAVSVAFPVITSSFGTSLILAGWVLSIYQLVATTAMPLAGKAGDIFGGKRTFMLSLSLFTAGSFLCAVAPNIQLLILSRFIQGMGGGSFMPIATGIVAHEFPKARQRAIGLFSTIWPIGQILGPNLGGWLVHAYGWRSVFWFSIPLGIIALVVSPFLLRAGQREEGRMDLVGGGLFSGSLFALISGLSQMGSTDTGSSMVLTGVLLVTAVVFMIAFVRHETKSKNPIIDLQVLKERPFMAANIYNLALGACGVGVMSFVPYYAVSIYQMTILESGLILTPRFIGMMIASAVTSLFLTRWGYRWPILVGTGTIVLSVFLLGIEPTGLNIMGIQLSSTVLLAVTMLLSGIGMGVAAPAANNACIELMPNRIATITGVRGMFRQSGGTISIAITSLLLQNAGSMAYGFAIVFIGLGVVMLMAVPFVFAMPKAP